MILKYKTNAKKKTICVYGSLFCTLVYSYYIMLVISVLFGQLKTQDKFVGKFKVRYFQLGKAVLLFRIFSPQFMETDMLFKRQLMHAKKLLNSSL